MSSREIIDTQVKTFHDTIEMPWKRSFLSLMRSTYLEDLIGETEISFSEKNNIFIRENWDSIKHLTLVDPFRMGVLIDLLEKVKDVEGDIVECGSYKGGSGILMGLWLKANGIKKTIHMMDSFAGLPDPDAVNDKGYKKGQFMSDFDLVKSEVEKNGLSDMVKFHKGWFSDTVPPMKNDVKIALFHVDCDLYTSTNDCFPDLYPAVTQGGAIVLDDFNDGGGGEKKAVHDYLERNELSEVIHISPAPQSFIIKGEAANDIIKVGGQKYSDQHISNNQPYLNWLKENYDLNLMENIQKVNSSA